MRYFGKWYFEKWYFNKWYFEKQYFEKWYLKHAVRHCEVIIKNAFKSLNRRLYDHEIISMLTSPCSFMRIFDSLKKLCFGKFTHF